MYRADGLGDGIRHLIFARLDVSCDFVDLGLDVGRYGDVALDEANTVVRQAERRDTRLEAAIGDALDRVIGGGIHALDSAGDDRRGDCRLIGIYADAPDTLALCCRQHAQTAAASYLEEDISAAGDLRGGLVSALRGIGEVVGVIDEDSRRRIFHLHGPLEASDVVIDGRNLLAANRANLMSLLRRLPLLRQHTRQDAHQRASLLLL